MTLILRLSAFAFVFVMSFAGGAVAQDRVWIQIESHSTLREAESRARAYGSVVDNINGYRLGTTWYSLALGPFDRDTATATLRQLRAQGVIPRDSFVSDGAAYSQQFWPIGTNNIEGPVVTAQPAETPTPPAEDPVAAPTAPLVVEVTPEPTAPADPPEETRREAQRSERDLNREERKDLQRGLEWFGFYTAGIDGAFGPGTRRSMSAWQEDKGYEVTGVLTTRQRAELLADWRAAEAALGLDLIVDDVAGIEIEAPMGLVQFDGYEAPFANYVARDGSATRMILISQAGDRGTMNGLYEILQTLEIVPSDGPRSKQRAGFTITGNGPDFTSETRVRLKDGHIYGFVLITTPDHATDAARILPRMEATLRSVGTPMPSSEGFDASEQSVDLVSGLAVRKPEFSRSGFFVDPDGRILTSAEMANPACTRLTINQIHDARVVASGDGYALIQSTEALAPIATARFASGDARLRSPMSVAGFPFEGVLGAATLTFGTLEDVKGLDGSNTIARLALNAQPGDAGGPVFDETGAVAGLLLSKDQEGRVLPADVAFAKKATALTEALTAQGVRAATSTNADAMAPEDLTLLAADITVLVSCWQ